MTVKVHKFLLCSVALFAFFSLSSCDGPHFKDQPDPPVVEKVDISVGDHEPEIEYEPVDENYVKELYNSVCVGEYLMSSYVTTGTWMYSGDKNTVDTISDYDKQLIVWNVFKGDSDIEGYPSGDFSGNGDELIYHDYPVSLFEERFHSVFGPDASITHETFQFSGYLAEYIEEKQIYCTRENHVWDNYEDGYKWNKLVAYEQKGEEIYLYDKFLYLSIGGEWYDLTIPSSFGAGIVPLFGNTEKTADSYVGEFFFDYVLEYFNNDEILDEHGYLYKHTFKRNDNGTYYWVSTEPYDGALGNATFVKNVDNSQVKEGEALNEKDVESIYSSFFNYNKSDTDNALDMFYKNSIVNVSDLSQQQLKAYTMIFYDGDISFNMPMSENGDFLRAYSSKRINFLARTLFGLDTVIVSESFLFKDILFEFDPEKGAFVGAFEGNNSASIASYMNKFFSYELEGNLLYIYDSVLTLEKAISLGIEKSFDWINSVDTEMFDLNSIPYKHTFKQIGGKNYHWVSSEPVLE